MTVVIITQVLKMLVTINYFLSHKYIYNIMSVPIKQTIKFDKFFIYFNSNLLIFSTLFFLFPFINSNNNTLILHSEKIKRVNINKSITISEVLDNFEEGNLDFCRSNIDYLSNKYKNNSNILYLQALLTVDGKKSVEKFRNIVTGFKTSSKYNIAKKKILDYKSLENYLNTNIRAKIVKKNVKKENTRNKVKIVRNTDRLKPVNINKYIFSVQLGVFSNANNAENLKNKYSYLGTFIEKETVDGEILNRVFSGKYKTENEALRRADFLMKRYELKTIIKELN